MITSCRVYKASQFQQVENLYLSDFMKLFPFTRVREHVRNRLLGWTLFAVAVAALPLRADPSATPTPNADGVGQPGPFPFQDSSLPLDKRLDDVLGRLTPDEKIEQLMMKAPAIPRLGIPAYHYWNEGLHGMARNGPATVFPQAIALGATWDPILEGKVADVISTEFRAKNNETISKNPGTNIYQGLTVWSPNINIFRDPRWGRGQETYGEDPYLTGCMGVAFVRGLQGDDPTYLKTVATLKHFAVHSGPEKLRHVFDAHPSGRDLHETYLPAFEAGITEGHAWSVMSAYNEVDGVPAPANKMLLTDILRTTWGFQGAVVGDVDTVGDAFGAHHYGTSPAEVCATCLKAGNDECSGGAYDHLHDSLKQGLITEADLNVALRRLFTLRFKLGMFDPADKVLYRKIPISALNAPENDTMALQAAREALVLLKNDGSLPWNPKDLKTVAILGPTADDNGAVVGNYAGTPVKPVNILMGITNKLKPLGITVLHDPAIPLVSGFRETGTTIPESSLFSDGQKTNTGLVGTFFSDDAFKKPIAGQPTRTEKALDLNWSEDQPLPALPLKDNKIEWTGVLIPNLTGEYALTLNFMGSARLYVDDKLLLDEKHPKDQKANHASTGLSLTAGQLYHLKVQYMQTPDSNMGKIQLGWRLPGGMEKALALAKQADHIILTLGLTPGLENEEMGVELEGFDRGDRTTIELPKIQEDLLAQVAALGKPTIVILTNGSALNFDTSKPNAILEAWYYGQRGGDAVAEAIVGETNPGGRLPVTFYKSSDDLPSFEDYSMANRTYRYFKGKPLYAFGYGLSYTTFTDEHITVSEEKADKTMDLSVKVTNTGKVAGDEVVQVYAHAEKPPVEMPLEWLIGFQRVHLNPGESQSVVIPLKEKNLRRWDEQGNKYVVDAGVYDLRVGSASDHILGEVPFTVKVTTP